MHTDRAHEREHDAPTSHAHATPTDMADEVSLDVLYAPSHWSSRLSPDVIVDHHIEVLHKGTLYQVTKLWGSGRKPPFDEPCRIITIVIDLFP